MNTPLATRFAAFGFAAVLTASMLLGVNSIATSELPAAQLARVQTLQGA
jgi:hypothetical protein